MIYSMLRTESPLMKDLGALALRLGLGGTMLLAHGLGKFSGYSQYLEKFPGVLGMSPENSLRMAIFAEVICAILLVIGAVTRVAALVLAITMGVAHFMIHAADPWNAKELSFVYFVGFAAIFLMGAGRFSVDQSLSK